MDELKNKCDMSINAISVSNKKEENIDCVKNTNESGNHVRMKSVSHKEACPAGCSASTICLDCRVMCSCGKKER